VEGAAERGQALFQSPSFAPSKINNYSCATCHGQSPEDHQKRILPGAWLGGVTERAAFWGGAETDLLRALNACRAEFQVTPVGLEADDPDASELYAYLVSLEPKQPGVVDFTVVEEIENIPRGDASLGQAMYAKACGYCHGEIHSGQGRLSRRIPILPEDTIDAHDGYTPRLLRLVFIEKVRHGAFLNYGGDMPPFSAEVLSDTELADILETLGARGE